MDKQTKKKSKLSFLKNYGEIWSALAMLASAIVVIVALKDGSKVTFMIAIMLLICIQLAFVASFNYYYRQHKKNKKNESAKDSHE